MNQAVEFLHALAQALSTIGLYAEEHPARVSALEHLLERLEALTAENRSPTFTFLKEEVVYLDTPLRELKGWGLSSRLAGCGVERLEFTPGVSTGTLGAFLVDLHLYLGEKKVLEEGSIDDFPGIRFGTVSHLEASGGGEADIDLYEQAGKAADLFAEARLLLVDFPE